MSTKYTNGTLETYWDVFKIWDIVEYKNWHLWNTYTIIDISPNDITIKSNKNNSIYTIKRIDMRKIRLVDVTTTDDLQNKLYGYVSGSFADWLVSAITSTDTWCIDYHIGYADTSKVWSVYIDKPNLNPNVWTDGQTNTLLINNNTMEKLNQIRADKFFTKEKNLVAIEKLDSLIKESIDLINDTQKQLANTEIKLNWLNNKLAAATNNQNVDVLKDLIASTKVIEEFINDFKWKSIDNFKTAKTKFDVSEYLNS